MTTWLLSTDLWDLVTDASGNWAVASDPYASAQDIASAVRTFVGDVYYDTTVGIPYFTEILGMIPSLPAVKALIVNAALTVPNVSAAVVFITGFTGRRLTGQIQAIMTNGTQVVTNF